jgi:hypothetical protein
MTIKITPEAGGTRAEIGMQKWFDKARLQPLAPFVFAPLLALAALRRLLAIPHTEDAWKIIEDHIARKAAVMFHLCRAVAAHCGAANVAGSDFCSA